MTDYAYEIRQAFIAQSTDRHALKLQALRDTMHAEGRALIGEEALAARKGWRVFHVVKKWGKAD